MAGSERDDRPTRPGETPGRRLATPPSDRYAQDRGASTPRPGTSGKTPGALRGPMVRAVVVALAGAGALLVVGAFLASTTGLLFVAGITGASIGLALARASVPRSDAQPAPPRTVRWLAVTIAIAAVAIGAVATWLVARTEGGTLGLVDYLLTVFGPFVPAEAAIAAAAAAWGAHAGPVQR